MSVLVLSARAAGALRRAAVGATREEGDKPLLKEVVHELDAQAAGFDPTPVAMAIADRVAKAGAAVVT